MPDPRRHDLYLSDSVWGELKLRAFSEKKTAGAVIAYLLDWAISNPQEIPPLSRYQARLSQDELEHREKRTIRGIPEELWARAEQTAQDAAPPFSISGLVEHLLRAYLGLTEGEAADEDEEPQLPTASEVRILRDRGDSSGFIQTGKVTFDLGKDPPEIDLNKRKP